MIGLLAESLNEQRVNDQRLSLLARTSVFLFAAILVSTALTSCGGSKSGKSAGGGAAPTSAETPTAPTTQQETPVDPTLAEPPRLSQVVVSAASASLVAGQSTTVVATLYDNRGKKFLGDIPGITFAIAAGGSSGTLSSAINHQDGTYSTTFTATTAGAPADLTASITSMDIASPPLSVSVSAGPADLSRSTVSIASPTISSGSTSMVTVVLRDAYDNLATSSGIVTLSVGNGTSSGSFSAVTKGENDYSATFTAITAGSQATITARLDGNALTGGHPAVLTVIPGTVNPDQSTLTASAATVAAGSDITLTLTRRDAAGNLITSNLDTVVFSKQSGVSSGSFSPATPQLDGTYTGTFTGTTAGSASTIIATINGLTITSTLPTVQVTPGPASLSGSVISASASTVVSGSTITARLTTYDAAGNALNTGGLTVAFSLSGGTSTGSFATTSDNGDGTYEAVLTGVIAGTAANITATVGGSLVTSTPAPSVTVTPGPATTSRSTVAIASNTLSSGATATVTVTLRDANNNLTTSAGTVALSIAGGTSSGTFSTVVPGGSTYTSQFTATTAGSQATISATLAGSSITGGTPALITVTPGSVNLSQSTLTTSDTSIASGSFATLTLIRRDAAGNVITSGSDIVTFSKLSGGSNGTFSSASLLGDGSHTATFTGTTAGSAATISATINGLPITSTLPTIQVTPGSASLAKSLITATSNNVASGSSIIVKLTTKDANNNLLNAGGLSVDFYLSGGTSTGSFGAVVDKGDGTYEASFTGEIAGTAATLKATINDAIVTSSPMPTISVNPGSADPDNSTITISSSSIASGANAIVTVNAVDINGNSITTGGSPVTFSMSGGTSTATMSSVTDHGNGSYSTILTGQTAGTSTTIAATIDGMAITSANPTLTVSVGPVSLIRSTVSVTVASIESSKTSIVTLTAKDQGHNLITSGGLNVSFSLSGGTSTGTFSAVTDNGDGTYSSIFTGITAGTASTVNALIDGSAVTSTLPVITVFSSTGIKYILSGLPDTVRSGIDYTANILVQDINNNLVTTYNSTTSVTSSDTAATLPADYTFAALDGGSHDFTVRFLTLGAKTVSFTDIAQPAINVLANVTVIPQDPDHLVWSGSTSGLAEACVGPLTLSTLDPVGNISGVLSTQTITYSGLGSATLYSDASCTSTVTSSTINTGASTTSVYIKDATAETLTIVASASGLSAANLAFQVKPIPSWVGNAYAASTGTNTGSSVLGRLDSQLMNPYAVVENNGYYYVADSTAHRILKYDAVSGAMIGWIGGVSGTPTGGEPGCTTATLGTPGWCLGGFATSGTGNNQFSTPRGLAIVGSWLYIADAGNNRIVRVDTATGNFGGWTGNVNTSPTGGTTGCAGKAVSTASSGWCTGGTAKAGTGDGMVSAPRGISSDGTYLYVADYNNFRVSRFFLNTGVFDGWIGWVATTPTAGAAGCSTAAVSSVTPGWCLGGTAKTGGTTSGQFKNPSAVMYYGGMLYTTGVENSIQRIVTNIDSTIAVTGWYGRGSTTPPTSGAAGCTTLASTATTPGWCVGGLIGTTGSNSKGQLNSPMGLSTDGTWIYIADQGNHRISKISLSTGAYGGSIGRVSSVGTGGDAGCTTASLWSYAPGWCIGATPISGVSGNTFNSVAGVAAAGSNILATDQNNSRLMIIDQTTGQPTGWLGAQDSSISAWTTSSYLSAISSNATGGYGFASSPIATGSTTMSGVAYDNGTLYVTDTNNHRVKSVTAATGETSGWIGGAQTVPTGGGAGCTSLALSSTSFTPAWCLGGSPRSGTTDGSYSSPQSSYAYGTYIYISDTANHRIVRVNKTTGAVSGWIGNVKTKPTGGGAGCTTATVGASTPTWCTGGASQSSAVTGSFNTPAGITSDGTYLYVVNSGSARVEKIDMATGVSAGWIGRVLTVPTGGATGCTSLAIGAIAQQWCTGGTTQASGTTAALLDGAFKTPRGIFFDGTWIYVADLGNHRITRHAPDTGAYGGWSGGITSSPTGGTAGCSGATTVTPGWCTGGTPKSTTGNGFSFPRDVTVVGGYYYVADSANSRVVKFTTAGVFTGWRGVVSTVPTSGDTGCTTTASGFSTPGWCKGGTSKRGLINGALDVPVGITSDGGSWLYVVDGVNGRIVRFPAN